MRPLAVFDTERIPEPEWKDIPTVKEALGADIQYLMLRGIFGAPDMPKDAVEWYVGFLKKVYDTPEFQDYLHKGALKPRLRDRRRVREVGGGGRAAAPGPDDEGRAAQEVDAGRRPRHRARSLMLLGGVVLYDALRLGIGWGTDGPQSGFFPFWLAARHGGRLRRRSLVAGVRGGRPARPFVTREQAAARS